MNKISYRRHRFPAEIIQRAVWLCFRFPLSYRDVEDLLAERGVDVDFLRDDTALVFKVWAGLCPKTETITPSTRRPVAP